MTFDRTPGDDEVAEPAVPTPHRYVVIEGPIGVGKTSLVRRLGRSFGSELVLEQDAENPFLERFYRNPRAVAFQTQLHFLRVRHTDFIFSVLAEEMGFIGAILFLLLFASLILRLIYVALQARDSYGRLIVAGVTSMLLVQAVINLGMNANILPVTGLPLPLVSSGGSSLVSTLFALGLVQSVIMRSKNIEELALL